MRLPRFRLWTLMIVVAVVGMILGGFIAAYREANRQVNLVEAEYCHLRAKEATNPTERAEFAKRAAFYDRMVRYYGGR